MLLCLEVPGSWYVGGFFDRSGLPLRSMASRSNGVPYFAWLTSRNSARHFFMYKRPLLVVANHLPPEPVISAAVTTIVAR